MKQMVVSLEKLLNLIDWLTGGADEEDQGAIIWTKQEIDEHEKLRQAHS